METPEPEGEPFTGSDDEDPCGNCPSRLYPRHQFLVYDRPTREAPFDPADGRRYTADGIPVCVHPGRVGLEPDRTAPPPCTVTEAALSDEGAGVSSGRARSRWRWPFLAG